MGFYELGNGCDSCDTISPIIPNNVNSNPYNSYGTQGGSMNQYNSGVVSSGYAQGGAMGSMGNGSNGSTMGTPMTTQTMVVQTVPVTTTTTQMKQVQVPGPAQVLIPTVTKRASTHEGFTDGSGSTNSMFQDKMWIVLGLVIFSSLAANECCKYFLNKSLQLNDGSPMYYVAYVVVAVLLTFAAYTYVSKN